MASKQSVIFLRMSCPDLFQSDNLSLSPALVERVSEAQKEMKTVLAYGLGDAFDRLAMLSVRQKKISFDLHDTAGSLELLKDWTIRFYSLRQAVYLVWSLHNMNLHNFCERTYLNF